MKEYVKPIIMGLLVVFACLGLGRFAFGMVLPLMQEELSMNATQAGLVGSANFLGYFIGLFIVSKTYTRFGPSLLVSWALFVQAFSMVLMAVAPHYLLAALFFSATGFFGALANIGIMTYIAQVVPPKMKGRATGIVVAGIGLAVIFSSLIVPTFEKFLPYAWRISWGVFALSIVLIGLWARSVMARFLVQANAHHAKGDTLLLRDIVRSRAFWHTGILFLLFGTTAIMFMTFFVAAVSDTYGASTQVSGIFWALLGVTSLFSGPFFGAVSDTIGRYKTLAILFGLQALAHSLLAFEVPLAWVFLSAGVFGFSTWAVPSIMATLSSELFGLSHTARIMSLITLFFGIGQMVGPLLAGIIRDLTGSYTFAFACSSSVLLGALFLSLYAQRSQKRT
ncbi:YbfB/YjiJ family MFS transporter [Sulfurospirillum sp. T05]|uniref:YbfB/YjiJ family MFS transporter n=1 Tax=Sulfurospirillum tamanense TaxID=2813362 RepID=A0ABS2WW94_9BACT|nr:MFS transporter [Sulfurospirillum tamanensis]MBN2965484.1 YbfB/YjiJ family MFS transporter [Sulfurospirillum tamanensis]